MQRCSIDIHIPIEEVARQFFDECFSSLYASMCVFWQRKLSPIHCGPATFEQRVGRFLRDATQNGLRPLAGTASALSESVRDADCKSVVGDGTGFEWNSGSVLGKTRGDTTAKAVSHKRGHKRASYLLESCVAKYTARTGSAQNGVAVTRNAVATSGMVSFPQCIERESGLTNRCSRCTSSLCGRQPLNNTLQFHSPESLDWPRYRSEGT